MEKVSFARADWPQKMQYMNEYDNFARLYGMQLVEYAEGYACVEMQMKPDFLNSQLRLHGSWQAALILIAAGKAARSMGREMRPCKLNMNYHHGVREGLLRVIARQKFASDNWLTVDVELHCLGDHSVNGDHAVGQPAVQAETPADILVASGHFQGY
ncbi:MAG: PaaI family thioesterase, partial [Firmicutes bacterium]|nr:PaaI family thioesterase [Bacillota bacterium]